MTQKMNQKPKKSTKLAKRAVSSPGTAIQKAIPSLPERIETLLMEGDLAPLSVPERLQYYKTLCRSLGLNPISRPFAYIVLNGKMVLYALRSATDQLRRVHGVSVIESKRTVEGDLTVFEVKVQDRTGRTDTGTGAWPTANLKGEAAVNALLKAETKAKRRATLSICGLGMLDQSELDTIDDVMGVTESGRVVEVLPAADPALERYEQREREQIAKLTPEQQEVLQSKMAKAKKVSPDQRPVETAAAAGPSAETHGAAAAAEYDGLTCGPLANEHYFIDGPKELKHEHRKLLLPLWKPLFAPPGLYATAYEFGKLCAAFEREKIKFRIL